MTKVKFCLLILTIVSAVNLKADDVPTISPLATYQGSDGEESGTNYSGSAPLEVQFTANAENTDGWSAYYEWRFTEEGSDTPYLTRYEENTSYTFTKAGSHYIKLYAIFTQGNDTVAYTDEYWESAEAITINISESKLQMPNAFTPNGDDKNDIYKAKDGYQSLVEFHAYIFNRWGQKLFEWTDPSTGWDGTYHGKPVKEGVYYVLVKAKGADGKVFNIRRDVNLIRDYNEEASTSSN